MNRHATYPFDTLGAEEDSCVGAVVEGGVGFTMWLPPFLGDARGVAKQV